MGGRAAVDRRPRAPRARRGRHARLASLPRTGAAGGLVLPLRDAFAYVSSLVDLPVPRRHRRRAATRSTPGRGTARSGTPPGAERSPTPAGASPATTSWWTGTARPSTSTWARVDAAPRRSCSVAPAPSTSGRSPVSSPVGDGPNAPDASVAGLTRARTCGATRAARAASTAPTLAASGASWERPPGRSPPRRGAG